VIATVAATKTKQRRAGAKGRSQSRPRR
jgi:hypothetical protein